MRIKAPYVGVAAVLAAVIVLPFAGTSSALPLGTAPTGSVFLTPSSGDSDTTFRLDLGSTAQFCPGDAVTAEYRWHTFITPLTNDPAPMTYTAAGTPNGPAFTANLRLTTGQQVRAENPGAGDGLVSPLPTDLNFASVAFATMPAGEYWVGVACTHPDAGFVNQTERFWSTAVTITGEAGAGPNDLTYQVGLKPAAPVATALSPSDETLTLAFTHAASTPPTTSYEATAVPTGGGAPVTATGTSSPIAITGLTNGTGYSVTVAATNDIGTSSASNALAGTPAPVAAPGAPTNVAGVPGNGLVFVSWSAPASNGGSPITGYTVTASPGGAQCTKAAPPLSCNVTGLTNGTAYTFAVTATNAVGTSVPSAASAPVTPVAVPGAPTGVTAVAGNGSSAVSWSAPTITGGSPITGYTATASPGGALCTTAGALTCNVTGLTNGTAYTFTVRATNAVGPSPASAPSVAVTPSTVPGAPTGVTGFPGDGKVTVSWTAPANTGGTPITGYTVTATPGGAQCTTTGVATCEVTGLSNGTSYTFTATATNTRGTSDPSAASAAVTPRPLDPPVVGSGAVAPGAIVCFQVAGLPGDVALVNLTPVLAGGAGNGQLISSGITPPVASNVNFAPGTVDPNVAVAPLGEDGKVCYANSEHNDTQVIADHLATISKDAITLATPTGASLRKVDTREGLGGGIVAPGGILCFEVAGAPGDVALVNLTPVLANGAGNGQLISSGITPPVASNVNFAPGTVDPNVALAPIGADGKVCYANSTHSSAHVIADHLATIDKDAITLATPTGASARKVDTREGLGGGLVAPGGVLCFEVAGSPGDLAIVNLTPVLASGPGNGQLISSGITPPVASNVNFGPGTVDPNVASAPIGADGTVCYANSTHSSVHVIADHLGTIDGDAVTLATPTGASARRVDTRPA